MRKESTIRNESASFCAGVSLAGFFFTCGLRPGFAVGVAATISTGARSAATVAIARSVLGDLMVVCLHCRSQHTFSNLLLSSPGYYSFSMKPRGLSDPHLTLATPQKVMHVFGEVWRDHPDRIRENWSRLVSPEDVVVLPGDISWASRLEDALTDLEFPHRLPGTKVLLDGNHERWWNTLSQVRAELPPSVKAISGDHVEVGSWLVFGTRLWETRQIDCDALVAWNQSTDKRPDKRTPEEDQRNEKIFQREIARLERCVQALPHRPWLRRICLTHYPPLGPDLEPSAASELVERSGATTCVFGHLHNLKKAPGGRSATSLAPHAGALRAGLCRSPGDGPVLLDET
ncbi:MAG: metallophosphoesterase [Fibrobacteres bacterium]|nr:metallophosphoesterase [Fibrobacterota bacterium]